MSFILAIDDTEEISSASIDNYSEQIPAVKLVHEILNQPSTNPPPAVENLDAIAAIEKYQPETVITSWMTIKGEDTEEVDGDCNEKRSYQKIIRRCNRSVNKNRK